MRRVRIGIIGAGATTEWAVLPALSGPDAVAPPDTGSWWGRRAGGASDIRYQAPARPDVVALCDLDGERARRVGEAMRVRAIYSDWRLMLREVEMDALLCLVAPAQVPEIIASAGAAVRWLWLDGPPALSSHETMQLARLLEGRSLRVWCAHPLRQAAAHRAAHRLLERGTLGEVCALNLRWSTPFHLAPATSLSPTSSPSVTAAPRPMRDTTSTTSSETIALKSVAATPGASAPNAGSTREDEANAGEADVGRESQQVEVAPSLASQHERQGESAMSSGSTANGDAPYLAASYAALSVLMAFGAPLSRGRSAASGNMISERGADSAWMQAQSGAAFGTVSRVMASQCSGATSLWLQFASGAGATALFAAAESWNAPFPRLEICGTQGRSLVCEAGRRLWFHQPREASHFLEPPGLSAQVSQANLIGLAEDLKAFLAAVAESGAGAFEAASAQTRDAQRDENTPAWNASGLANDGHSLIEAARVLRVLEAAAIALRTGAPSVVATLASTLEPDVSSNGAATASATASAAEASSPRTTTTRDTSRTAAKSDANRNTLPATLPLPL